MHLFDVFFHACREQPVLRLDRRRPDPFALSEIAEAFLEHRKQRFAFKAARGGDHDVLRRIMPVQIVEKILALHRADRFIRAEDLGFERRAAIQSRTGAVERDVLRTVLRHRKLLEHHASFLCKLLGIERAVRQNIRQHVDCGFQILVEYLHVKAGAFLGGKRVEIAAERIHFRRDVRGAARLCSLEEHVLDKMRDAEFRTGFKHRSGVDPYAERNRAHVFHALRDHADAVR